MNILQIVTLVSADGAYGGPVRVAFNQARQLRARGHEVRIVGSYRGYDVPPDCIEGTPVHLSKARTVLPGVGFAGLAAPATFMWMIRNRRTFDVVHVHAARDCVTLPAAALAMLLGKHVVLQTHGMIDRSRRTLARLLDVLLTKRVLRQAAAVLYLTEAERTELLHIQKCCRTEHLANGVPQYGGKLAETAPGDRIEVLYLARLHKRKRPLAFVAAAVELLDEGIPAVFTLVGPDEGELEGVQTSIAVAQRANRIRWEGAAPPSETVRRMQRASIYVLPSVDEPYPMSVLEALSVGLPVVITKSCGLAEMVERTGCGIVVDDSQQSLVAALRSLIEDQERRISMGDKARSTAVREFSMDSVARKLEQLYGREPAVRAP
ncbi:glycosyltransferase [Mycolicibacterium phocaicum]|uniref:Glycosyltransferase n=1 Tax=Mycolicibacterium phocaicum TaxID=319706 RepID=A0A7I7ZQ53_9MYCO|nr:glycosyltransferase [Mycolicibacterium phocaicum]TLH81072.1 glycosyltransferase [Mycolicibacterium phocaicum]BBZ56378.1 glycosyl transferase family 1 [Mycolicibacterium phocaicum]